MKPDDLDPIAFRERLSAYLDGEMEPAEAGRFLAWLEAHPAALKDAEEARRVWALLSTYVDEPVPEGFAERVFAKVGIASSTRADSLPGAVAGRSPALRLLAGGRRRALAAAAAVLVAVGGTVLWRGSTTSQTESSVSAALEAVPAELLESEYLASFAALSDEEFEALLSTDPETLATDASKTRGG
jgi:anti-sigma factor RsiW